MLNVGVWLCALLSYISVVVEGMTFQRNTSLDVKTEHPFFFLFPFFWCICLSANQTGSPYQTACIKYCSKRIIGWKSVLFDGPTPPINFSQVFLRDGYRGNGTDIEMGLGGMGAERCVPRYSNGVESGGWLGPEGGAGYRDYSGNHALSSKYAEGVHQGHPLAYVVTRESWDQPLPGPPF